MAIAENPEVGDSLQIEQPRAGQTKEVAEHAIRVPRIRQMGEAVEHINGFATGGLDDGMHLIDKRLEARPGIGMVRLDTIEQRRMIGEAKVNQAPLCRQRSCGIRPHKCLVVF